MPDVSGFADAEQLIFVLNGEGGVTLQQLLASELHRAVALVLRFALYTKKLVGKHQLSGIE